MRPPTRTEPSLGLNLGSDITIRNLTLQGTHSVAQYDSAHEWDHNLRIFGTHGVLVDNVTFRNAWGDAVTVSPAAAGTPPETRR